jgi:hypothetical protein|tara:strand:- start:164 stop:385 length:222 start_codon:yes stop_codon:yes gene_type:complete
VLISIAGPAAEKTAVEGAVVVVGGGVAVATRAESGNGGMGGSNNSKPAGLLIPVLSNGMFGHALIKVGYALEM